MKKLFTPMVLRCLAQGNNVKPRFIYVEAPKGIPFGSDGPALPPNPEDFNKTLDRAVKLGEALAGSLPDPKAQRAETQAETRAKVGDLKQTIEVARKPSPEEEERNRYRQEALDLTAKANSILPAFDKVTAPDVIAKRNQMVAARDVVSRQNDPSYKLELDLAKEQDPVMKKGLRAALAAQMQILMNNNQKLKDSIAALEGKPVEPDPRGTLQERMNRYINRSRAEALLRRTEKVLADTNLQKVNFELFKQIVALRDNVKGNLDLSYKAEIDLIITKDATAKNQMRLMAEKLSADQVAKNADLETKLNTISAP